MNKQAFKNILTEVFNNKEFTLIPLAIGSGDYTASSWDFLYVGNEDEIECSQYAIDEDLPEEREDSSVLFCRDLSNKTVVSIINEILDKLPRLNEDALTLYCAKNRLGNSFWRVIASLDKNGNIVLAQIRDDGLEGNEPDIFISSSEVFKNIVEE